MEELAQRLMSGGASVEHMALRTGYVSDKFAALKLSSSEVFDKICQVIADLLNEAQIVWNENFNAVSNAQPSVASPPPVASPTPVIVDAL